MRRQECLASCRRPAIDGDLNQCVFDLVDGNATRTRRIRINAKLLKAAQSCEDAKRQDIRVFWPPFIRFGSNLTRM